MARDNFSKAVIEKLHKRVAGRCSNPTCRVPTIGPSSDPDKSISIGVAAHITAASIGGPRYCHTMTERARKSMDNGIWLCSNCSIAIDRDIDRYPVELLNKWKIDAENAAKQELGKRLPDKNDAIDTLTSALTGQVKNFIPEAISNIHRASSIALEMLDPRFAIKSTYVDGVTHFGLFAKQDVPLMISVKKEYAQEYTEKFKSLVDHGVELTINGDAASIEGSRLFDEFTTSSSNSTLKISPRKSQATQKIWLINKNTSAVENFDDINGSISIGQQSFSFSGTACNNIFTFNYQKLIWKENSSTTVNLTIHFEKWSGIDVRVLPYFNKIYSFFEKLHDGWVLYTSLEINGIEMLRSKEVAINTTDFVKVILQALDIINMAKTIATTLNISIPFHPDYSFTTQEFSDLCDAVSIARGNFVFHEKDLNENITCDLVVNNNAINSSFLIQPSAPMDFKIVQKDSNALQLFGNQFKLPNKIFNIRSAIPRIVSGDNIENLSDGDVITIEWFPSDKFECKIEFEKSVV
jgi:hypothetical protein